ncbi:unnamed protein product [Schistocephalus solidus]|uniref:Uncharacterized protein n=1 Tax=Schistocephalus solidus TaxID=70667 RepID=A0A183SXB1_SCHSO|nr:unnamed protein product [Schistocephalus solidus]
MEEEEKEEEEEEEEDEEDEEENDDNDDEVVMDEFDLIRNNNDMTSFFLMLETCCPENKEGRITVAFRQTARVPSRDPRATNPVPSIFLHSNCNQEHEAAKQFAFPLPLFIPETRQGAAHPNR